jgi:hypothetical protein
VQLRGRETTGGVSKALEQGTLYLALAMIDDDPEEEIVPIGPFVLPY